MAYITATNTNISEAATASYTPDSLPEHATNDVIFACITQDTGTTAITTATSGWTGIGTQSASGASRQGWFYKVAASASETIPTFAGTNDDWIIHFYTVRDADTTTPVHGQARSNWNNISNPATPALTTTNDNCLILYSMGTDGISEMITPPSDMVPLEKEVNVGIASISGFRNQYTAGAVPVITALHEVSNEGGNTWTIAVENASGGSMGPETTAAMEVIRYYGVGNWGGTFSALSSVAATIDGVTCSANVPTLSVLGTISDSPWGNTSAFTSSSSVTPSFEGVIDTLSAAVDLSDVPVSVMFTALTSIATTRYGTFGVGMIIADSAGNWIVYQIVPRTLLRLRTYYLTMNLGEGTIYDQSASPIDLTDITKIGWFTERTAGTTSGAVYSVKFMVKQSGAVAIGGSTDSPLNTDILINSLNTGWGYINYAQQQGNGQFLRRQAIQIGDGATPTVVNFLATSIELAKTRQSISATQNTNFLPKDYTLDFVIYASASDVMDFSSSIIAVSSPQDFIIHASSSVSATYNFQGCSIVGYRVTNNVSGIVFNGAVFSTNLGITLNGGGMNNCSVLDSAATAAVTTNDPEQIVDTIFESAGTGHAIEISAVGSYAFEGNSFTGYGADGTTDAAIYNNSGGAVELVIPLGDATPTVRNGAGASTTITQPTNNQSVTLTGGVANSRVQIYDLTSSTELVNQIVTTFPFTWTDATPYVADREIRLRVAYQNGTTAKIFIDQVIGTATNASPAIPFLINQEDDEVYIDNAIDGSTVTGIVVDDAAFLVEIDTGTTTWASLYAYETYWLYTAAGILDEGRFIVARDTANYIFYDFQIKNITFPSVPLTITGAWARDSVTGQTETLIDTTGGTIFSNPDLVISYAVGSGVTPTDITDIAAAVWDEATSGHTTAGTTGKTLTDAKAKAALAASLSA